MAIRHEAAFTREWLDRLFKSLGDGDVLVGGQALVFWAGWFGLIGEDNPDITKDADILGGFDSVAAIARAMNGKASYPPASGFGTALQGQVEIDIGNGDFLNVDILRTVAGLGVDQARRRAVPVCTDNRQMVRVMHPVDVFCSKLANLSKFKEKQNKEGIRQAMLAVQIAKSYLADLEGRNPGGAVKFANEIFKFGKSKLGLNVRQFGVDPFDALDGLAVAGSPNYNNIGWPRMKAVIDAIRTDTAKAGQADGDDADDGGGCFHSQ